MWLLSCAASSDASSSQNRVYLIPNKNYTVGRKRDECEIFVDNDKSISRKHAVFSMEDVNVKQVLIQTQSDPIIRPILSLTDYSKYGTFVLKNGNYEKIGENNKIEIVDDTTIRFGVYESVYTASYQLVVFCVSRIDQKDRKKLANQCKTIDAKYATIWSPHCTHLIVNESDFAITEKLALALLLCIPIVTMSFVDELEKTLTTGNSSNIKLPDPDSFAPSSEKSGWKDIGLQFPPDLKQDPKRKNILNGKHFLVFNDAMFQKSSLVVETGGGKISNVSNEAIDDTFVKTYCNCHILVDDPSSLTTDQLSKLQYYGFQFFTNTNILATILSKDISHLEITKTPSIPKPVQIKTEPESLKRKEISLPTVVDEDATDDELAQPTTIETPPKKVKPSSDDTNTKKRKGIEIPLSLEALESEAKSSVVDEENPKKVSPKAEAKQEKKVSVKQERSHDEVDDDAPKIIVEYINLIKVKDEKPASQNSYTGFNAKRFKKAKVLKTSTSIIPSNFSSPPPLAQESMNFNDEVTSPKSAKAQDFTASTPKQKKEEMINTTPPSSSKKETLTSVMNAIGIDEESDDSDDEAITLLKASKKKR